MFHPTWLEKCARQTKAGQRTSQGLVPSLDRSGAALPWVSRGETTALSRRGGDGLLGGRRGAPADVLLLRQIPSAIAHDRAGPRPPVLPLSSLTPTGTRSLSLSSSSREHPAVQRQPPSTTADETGEYACKHEDQLEQERPVTEGRSAL